MIKRHNARANRLKRKRRVRARIFGTPERQRLNVFRTQVRVVREGGQDVYTFDALAWALYRNSKFPEAYDAVKKAMKLDTPEPQFYFHASLIADALGKADEADQLWSKAVRLNPFWPKPGGRK